MKLFKKFDDIYLNESLERKFIAKSLLWVCFVIGGVFLLGSLMNLRDKDYFSASIEFVFGLYLYGSISLIYKKKTHFVANSVIVMALLIGFLIGVISIDNSLYASFVSLVYLVPTMACIALLGSSLIFAVSSAIFIMVSLVFTYFFRVLPTAQEMGLSIPSTIHFLITPLLMAMVVSIISILVLYSTKSIIGKLFISETESRDRLGSITSVFHSLKETINIGEDLNNSAGNSLNLTNTISANLKSIEASLGKLHIQIESTQKIHESIDLAGQEVQKSTYTQSSAVEQSTSAVEEMSASIMEMSRTAESRRELIEDLIQTEKEVSHQIINGQKSFDIVKNSSNEMLGVVAVISDIAERTNLLAMNAAIEAAHAGNSGRGFAIVAQEIRKLAEEAGNNTQKIKVIIENGIKGIENAVEINQKVGSEFHMVSTQVRDIDIALSEIINGFSELATGTNEINRVVENLSLINHTVQSSVDKVTSELSKGRESVDSISLAAIEIKKNIEGIAVDSLSIHSEAENIYQIGQDNVKHIRMLEENLV
jgi:methyl-accepting chemotaxis protein